jgi:hypothetical protein
MCCNSKQAKQTVQTTVSVPPPSAEEQQRQSIADAVQSQSLRAAGQKVVIGPQDEAGKAQMADLQQKYDAALAGGGKAGVDPYITDIGNQLDKIKNQASVIDIPDAELSASELQDRQINQKIRQYALDQIQQQIDAAGGPTQQTKDLVSQTYGAQRTQGEKEISRFMTEEAARRGLNVTDTPLTRELGIQTGNLETSLRGAEASSLLDVAQKDKLFAASYNEFYQNLQQQRLNSRFSLANQYQNMANLFTSQRYATPTTTQTSQGFSSGGGGGIGGILGGAGGFLQGGSKLLGAFGSFGGGAAGTAAGAGAGGSAVSFL